MFICFSLNFEVVNALSNFNNVVANELYLKNILEC